MYGMNGSSASRTIRDCCHRARIVFFPTAATVLPAIPMTGMMTATTRWPDTTTRTMYNYGQHPNEWKVKRRKDDPFRILGVKPEEQYSVVKRTFLELAMKHHPDTAKATTREEQEANRDLFITIRKAFESLVEGPEGVAILRSDEDEAWKREELNSWFKQHSGMDMPYMDIQTMKEVAEVTEKMGGESGGLDRDGGMWTLARMVAQNVKNGGDGRAVLQLEAGEERNRQINGILRRKQKR